MDNELRNRAVTLYTLGVIGFVACFLLVFGNFFFSGVARWPSCPA